jgi:hypothetical protein
VDLTLIDGFRGKRFRDDGLVGKAEPFHHGVRHSPAAPPANSNLLVQMVANGLPRLMQASDAKGIQNLTGYEAGAKSSGRKL